MCSKLWLFELNKYQFQTKHHFLHKTVVFEVANFKFLVNFRFLTLINMGHKNIEKTIRSLICLKLKLKIN